MDNKNTHEIDFEYNQITEEIFIGTNLCCEIHFKEELLNRSITADMSLEKKRIDRPFGVEFFFWIPTEDELSPSEDQFVLGVSILKKCVELKRKIYVHCTHGHGRAPTMVAAYFISQGDTVEGAIQRIKDKRSVIHLNERQIDALKQFQSRLT